MREGLSRVVTVEQMRAIEQEANQRGISYDAMMETAGKGVARVALEVGEGEGEQIVLGLVGTGNNGGDALVALTAMAKEGWQARAYLARTRPQDDPRVRHFLSAGGEIIDHENDSGYSMLDQWLASATILIDGVLGTGIRLPLKPELAEVLKHVVSFPELPFVIALDCPSGVDSDSGEAAPEAIAADLTVCIEAVKSGLLKFPAFERCGSIEVVSLGLPQDLSGYSDIQDYIASSDYISHVLPERQLSSHKGTFGTAMVAAGSFNYTGAAYLAAKAAYRIGAGLVRAAVPAPLHTALAGQLPEATWLLLPHEVGVIGSHAAGVVLKNLERVTALLVGPGIGVEETTGVFLRLLLEHKPHSGRGKIGFLADRPESSQEETSSLPRMVIDADGLRLLVKIENWHKLLPAPAILTPHPGEMGLMTGLSVDQIQSDRVGTAHKFASAWGHIIVLKGAVTVIASPDGDTICIPIATPALARAGTGDVLAGMITGLLAQGLAPIDAAAAGCWIHARAGLAALAQVGHSASVLAGDVLEAIPTVLSYYEH